MIKIEVDCNSDEINVIDEKGHTICSTKVTHPNKYITLFQQIFDKLNSNTTLGVQLVQIDENRTKNFGEW